MVIGANTSARELLALARRTAGEVRDAKSTATRRFSLCKELLSGDIRTPSLEEFHSALSRLDVGTSHYWIGTFYAQLLSPSERRSKAAYFTPPHLADAIVSLLLKEGFDLGKHTAIDPAAGGAAFLSTLASRMAGSNVAHKNIPHRLSGVELDSGLARLSEALIAKRLGTQIKATSIVQNGDALKKRNLGTFDLVVANPPYGRISQSDIQSRKWRDVCYSGHINKYALFTDLCFKLAKPGGLVALVLPSSLIAGPLYDLLRSYIREHSQLLILGSVPDRQDVFADVAQDVSVVIARRSAGHQAEKPVVFGRFDNTKTFKATTAAKLADGKRDPWPVPAHATGLTRGGSVLEDYGASVKAGYFVWNREQERMFARRYSDAYVPLVWAKNVQAGKFCSPKAKKRDGLDFVRFGENQTAIVRKHAIVLQRTTNSAQKRRLIAARISPSVLKKWGGFVTENHTLIITAPTLETLDRLCILLNSRAVDLRYRQVSGTASVSVKLLRTLDLPSPAALTDALQRSADVEYAVDIAYALSNPSGKKAAA